MSDWPDSLPNLTSVSPEPYKAYRDIRENTKYRELHASYNDTRFPYPNQPTIWAEKKLEN